MQILALRRLIVIAICSFCCLFVGTVQAQPTQKRALLIGVQGYTRAGGKFEDLGTINDLKSIRYVLRHKFQFASRDVKQLDTKSLTTRKSILDSIRTFLVEPTRPGDIVFLYYSGHGSQVADSNEPDGMDESLVPSDYTNDGSRDICDKEVASLLTELRERQPGSVTLVFDCCHSSTLARSGHLKVRGLGWKRRYHRPLPKLHPPVSSSTRLPSRNPMGPNFVVLSACEDDGLALEMGKGQTGMEKEQMGRLTYFLSQAMLESRPYTTYEDVFEKISAEFAQRFREQVPTIEGNPNRLLLQGTAVPPQTYIPCRLTPTGKPIVQRGAIQGLTRGSKLAIFPAGSRSLDARFKIAEAQVTQVEDFEASVAITKIMASSFDMRQFKGARAVEIFHEYGDNQLTLDLSDLAFLPDRAKILEYIRTLAPSSELKNGPIRTQLRPGEQARLRIIGLSGTGLSQAQTIGRVAAPYTRPQSNSTTALVRADDGTIIEIFPVADRALKIREALRREAKYRSVKELNNRAPGAVVKVEMRLVPANVNRKAGVDVWVSDQTSSPVAPTKNSFQPGDWVTIEVRNTGQSDAWITALDLTNDGNVNLLWPPNDPQQPVTNKLGVSARQWHKLWKTESYNVPWPIKLTKPYGTEIFKIVATLEPVDLRGLTTRGPVTPLQRLLKAAMAGTRAERGAVPTQWSTAVKTVQIEP